MNTTHPGCLHFVCRLRQQLQSEQQQNQALLVAVRSVQRTQAAAASSYLAGVTRPDSPPLTAAAAHSPATFVGGGVRSRPASAAAGRIQQQTAVPWGLQAHQHQHAPSSSSIKSRPSSAGWRPAVPMPWGVSSAAGVLQGSSSSSIGWPQNAGGQHRVSAARCGLGWQLGSRDGAAHIRTVAVLRAVKSAGV
jgi:hypothetical protein